MEIYKYGPLVYNTPDSEEDTGNYYWSGSPPVGYDSARVCLLMTRVFSV